MCFSFGLRRINFIVEPPWTSEKRKMLPTVSQVIWWRNLEDWEKKIQGRIPQPRAALGVVSKLPEAFPSPKLHRSFRVYHISCYWMNILVDPTSSNLASGMLNSKIRPRAVVGYGVKIFHHSPPNYVTRSPGGLCFDPKRKYFEIFVSLEIQSYFRYILS